MAAPWFLFSGQGAKCQGRRAVFSSPLALPLTLWELTATYPAIWSCSMASRCFMFMYFFIPHWVPATCRSRAQTSIRAEFPLGKAPTTLVLRRISRFIRSITLSLKKKDFSLCAACDTKEYCSKCPGNALLEKGDFFKCSTLDKRLSTIATEMYVVTEGSAGCPLLQK